MTMITTTSISPLVETAHGTRSRLQAKFRAFWGRLIYRPELHYMRGPGPAWRAKYGIDAPFRLNRGDL